MNDAQNATVAFDDPPSGRTLAAAYYLDQNVIGAELADLLHHSWQFACHVSDVPNPGDFFTLAIQGQDYFVVRTLVGDLKAFANVCPHRGHRLVEGQGNKTRITCPYHAWTFGLDGALRGARGMARKRQDFARFGLIEVALDTLAGFVFLNPGNAAPPLSDYAPGLEGQMLRACPDLADYVPHRDGSAFGHTYVCQANWKVMIDNYLECYHCQTAHPDFNEMMSIPDSKFALFPNFTYQRAPTQGKSQNHAFPLDLDHDVLVGEFWWLFPNITLGRFPGTQNFYVSRFDPLEPGVTSRLTLSLKPREATDTGMAERERLRSVWTTTVVSQEDKALCENVQRGMAQRGFRHGWYVTDLDDHGVSEHAMRYFHDLYRVWAQAAVDPVARRD